MLHRPLRETMQDWENYLIKEHKQAHCQVFQRTDELMNFFQLFAFDDLGALITLTL